MDPRKRGTILAVAALVSVFMAGVLTSAAVIQVLNSRSQATAFRPGPNGQFRFPGGRPGADRDGLGRPDLMMSQFMADRLGLTEEQRQQLREVLSRRQEESEAVLEEIRPVLEANLDSTFAEIREILTPEQQERFDQFRTEGRERLFERFGPRPGFRDGRRGPPRR